MTHEEIMKDIFEEKEQSFWNKVVDFFKYTIWDNLTTAYYNTKWFFHNIGVFWSTLWNYRDWGYEYIIDANKVMLAQLANCIENGVEETRSASKKVKKIRELIEILNIDVDDIITDKILEGYRSNIPKEYVEEDCYKFRKQHYERIFEILYGQDSKWFSEQMKQKIEILKTENPELYEKYKKDGAYEIWVDIFDGTGVEGWWE